VGAVAGGDADALEAQILEIQELGLKRGDILRGRKTRHRAPRNEIVIPRNKKQVRDAGLCDLMRSRPRSISAANVASACDANAPTAPRW
jgi:hypothetical protein